MNRKELLEQYVKSPNPTINSELRNGIESKNALLFDTLFELGEVPPKLYRWMPNEYIRVDNNNTIVDPAYLSCSKSVDYFCKHVTENNLACLVIETQQKTKHINVQKELPNYNDEGEYILPRNLSLKLKRKEQCSNLTDMEKFLCKEGSVVSAKELKGSGINSFWVYYFVL